MSSSRPSPQCLRSTGLTLPCTLPAKKARMPRRDTGSPPTYRSGRLGVRIVVSGSDTSLPGVKIPSELSALHSALTVFRRRSPCAVVVLVYPIMAGDEEMVGASGAIPERVLGGEAFDEVAEVGGQRPEVVGVGNVERDPELLGAVGKVEEVRLGGVGDGEPPALLEELHEPALGRVDAAEGRRVEDGPPAVLVNVNFEYPFHQFIAPG
ncbi:hypothetical protein EE612_004596 [Oryza sativa]|nr:hypothetical protein EE612_004596 [Oryza sativa]